MSEILKDRAVVLRTYDYGETSLVVSFLTRSYGKVRMLAKGAKREKSSFAGALRTGNIGEIVFYFKPDRGLQLLKEIESGNVFENAVEMWFALFQARKSHLCSSVLISVQQKLKPNPVRFTRYAFIVPSHSTN